MNTDDTHNEVIPEREAKSLHPETNHSQNRIKKAAHLRLLLSFSVSEIICYFFILFVMCCHVLGQRPLNVRLARRMALYKGKLRNCASLAAEQFPAPKPNVCSSSRAIHNERSQQPWVTSAINHAFGVLART